jgi:prepilin-type N-terminal cleavage/methylation domain-containing protein
MRPPAALHRKGFTLIELIVTIAILAIIATAVFAGIDPRRRLNTGFPLQ